MSPQVELYRAAKRVLARDLTLTDEQVGEAWGLPRHVTAGWSAGTPERMAIGQARREIEQAHADQQQAVRDQQRLRPSLPWTQ